MAAFILYFPANILPIMISSNPTALEINTIFNGIVYMWDDGDRLIAVIIFSASIMVPVLKIIAMAVLIYSAYFKPVMSADKMSVLYRITESIGRWSMIDIFVIIILMSSFHTNMARVVPGGAAIYFCLVVILTMLSAYYFDPRLIWDKQQQLSDGLDSDQTLKTMKKHDSSPNYHAPGACQENQCLHVYRVADSTDCADCRRLAFG